MTDSAAGAAWAATAGVYCAGYGMDHDGRQGCAGGPVQTGFDHAGGAKNGPRGAGGRVFYRWKYWRGDGHGKDGFGNAVWRGSTGAGADPADRASSPFAAAGCWRERGLRPG